MTLLRRTHPSPAPRTEIASPARGRDPLYRRIAKDFEVQIRGGVLRPGEKLPSVRALSRQRGVSVFTVVQAYAWLERLGCVEPRARSGYVARIPPDAGASEPAPRPGVQSPVRVGVGQAVARVMSVTTQNLVPLGTATIDPLHLPVRMVNRLLREAIRTSPEHGSHYQPTAGLWALRRQIARHALSYGCAFHPDETVITGGALEALHLSLRAVAGPGDVVAVEHPTYFGLLQVVESAGIRVVEIATSPRHGPDLECLEQAIKRHRIKAFLTIPNCHNPLGYVLPDQHKRDLVALTGRHGVPVIEDDIYGELAFSHRRPQPAKAFDAEGLVILCSSFSKTVGPGLRVGWVHGGRFAARIAALKALTTGPTSTLSQMALARFLEAGAFFRHVRRLRPWLRTQVQRYTAEIGRTFPPETAISRPAGGHLIWVELPNRGNGDRLHLEALSRGISIVPGSIFSASGRYSGYVRVNCGHGWSPSIESGIATLARLAARLA